MSVMDFTRYDDKARKMSAYLASAVYAALTSDQHDVSDYRAAMPVLLDMALNQALKVTYRLSDSQARLVRELLGEYGLTDQLESTTTTGLEGLVEFVVTNPESNRS
jgi:hypothetical protein